MRFYKKKPSIAYKFKLESNHKYHIIAMFSGTGSYSMYRQKKNGKMVIYCVYLLAECEDAKGEKFILDNDGLPSLKPIILEFSEENFNNNISEKNFNNNISIEAMEKIGQTSATHHIGNSGDSNFCHLIIETGNLGIGEDDFSKGLNKNATIQLSEACKATFWQYTGLFEKLAFYDERVIDYRKTEEDYLKLYAINYFYKKEPSIAYKFKLQSNHKYHIFAMVSGTGSYSMYKQNKNGKMVIYCVYLLAECEDAKGEKFILDNDGLPSLKPIILEFSEENFNNNISIEAKEEIRQTSGTHRIGNPGNSDFCHLIIETGNLGIGEDDFSKGLNKNATIQLSEGCKGIFWQHEGIFEKLAFYKEEVIDYRKTEEDYLKLYTINYDN